MQEGQKMHIELFSFFENMRNMEDMGRKGIALIPGPFTG
jgi:hypothetical protein